MSRFTSKLAGMQKARGGWLCTDCRMPCPTKQKRDICPDCGHDALRHFPSQREMKRAAELLLAERAGAIEQLRFHPRYPLIVNGVTVATYVADAAYLENSLPVIEDTKPVGFMTAEAKLRIALFGACYAPLQVRIV